VAIAPLAQLAQLLHLGVIVENVVLLRETCRIVHPNITTKTEEDACCFKGEESRV
jgi:hypothetical protein